MQKVGEFIESPTFGQNRLFILTLTQTLSLIIELSFKIKEDIEGEVDGLYS